MPKLVHREVWPAISSGAWPRWWGTKINYGTVGSSAVNMNTSAGRILSSTTTGTSTGTTLTGIPCPYNFEVLVRYLQTANLGYVHFRGRATNDLTGPNAGTTGVSCSASPGIDDLELGYDDAADAGFMGLGAVSGSLGGNKTVAVWLRWRVIGNMSMARTWVITGQEPNQWHATGDITAAAGQQSGGYFKLFVENDTAAARTVRFYEMSLWDMMQGPDLPRLGAGVRL